MITIKRTFPFLVVLQVMMHAGISFSDEGEKSKEKEGSQLVLAAPEKMEIGFGSWDASATGGQTPSWAYLITLRTKTKEEASTERTSWGQNAYFANAIHFFKSGSLTKKIEIAWKPSSIPDWSGPDESVYLGIGAGGEHITYRRKVMGPVVKGNRKPILIDERIYDRNGAQVNDDVHIGGPTSLSGKFARGTNGFWDLASGTPYRTDGSMLFSSYDDSFVVYRPGQGSIDYYDINGQKRWRAEIAIGPLRLAVVSPGGRYVIAVAGAGEHKDAAAVVDATGRILWKVLVSEGSYAAAFSRDSRQVALVTNDANAIYDTETGKVLARVAMSEVLGNEKDVPHSSKIHVASDRALATVITPTIRKEMRGALFASGGDLVYEFGVDGARVNARFPPRTFTLVEGGIGYTPAVTLSPDGQWLYYVTDKGLLARRLK